jgi:signal transduction histidine kinase
MVSERFARSASRGLPIPRQVRLGTALAATAGVSLVVPVNSRAAFVTALVFMMGARLAGFDAWSGLLRSAGFYRRAALSWSGARVTVIWLVFLTVWFLVIWGWFVDGVLDRGLGVQRLVPRTTQLAQTIVVVAVVPAVVGVCELISGIARHEAKVQSLLVETARARQSALTARRIHQRAASLIPVLRMSTGDQLHDAIDELDVNLRQLLLEDRITAGDARFEDCLDRAVKRARLVNVDLVTRVEGADPTDLVPQGCGSVLDEAIFELVANAAKAGAARITVTIAVTTDALRVDVTDDAGGFDVRNARGRGGGLSQLERDLADICGTLEIHSDRGFTLVRVRIPRSIEYEDAP